MAACQSWTTDEFRQAVIAARDVVETFSKHRYSSGKYAYPMIIHKMGVFVIKNKVSLLTPFKMGRKCMVFTHFMFLFLTHGPVDLVRNIFQHL